MTRVERWIRHHHHLFLLAAAIFGGLLPSAVLAADETDAIAYRRHLMKAMSEQAAALGMVLQDKGPAENAAFHARAIALNAQAAVKAFEANVPGGEARPEIWRDWPDFTKRLKNLYDGANELAVIAERNGLAAMQARAMNVLTCKSCHDAYKLRPGR